MNVIIKRDGVQFAHGDDFRGDVKITRGDQTLTVPIETLRKFVAESVRYDMLVRVAALKPETLLRGAV